MLDSPYKRRARTTRRKVGRCGSFLVSLLVCMPTVQSVLAQSQDGSQARSWKTLDGLSADELAQIDQRTDTPRHAEFSYLPAEPYPFRPP